MGEAVGQGGQQAGSSHWLACGSEDPVSNLEGTTPTLIQSLRRGLRLLEAVVDRGPTTARALSEATDLPLPTTHHLLRTLVHEGYLNRIGGGAYALGRQCQSAAELERSVRSVPALHLELRALAKATGASVCLAGLEDDVVRLLNFIPGPRAPRVDWFSGMALPAHATAVGKCILAQLTAEERHSYIHRHPLGQMTARTIVDSVRLELDLVGDDLYRCSQEHTYGVAGVATAIQVPELGALGLVHSAGATRNRDRIETLLRESARRVSDLLAGGGLRAAHGCS